MIRLIKVTKLDSMMLSCGCTKATVKIYKAICEHSVNLFRDVDNDGGGNGTIELH